MNLNRVTLIGRAGKDVEIKQSKTNGKSFAVFTLATSESWMDKASGHFKSDTQWHSITIFNEKIVEKAMRIVRKGALLLVEGKLKYRKYTDAKGNEATASGIEIETFGGNLLSLEKNKGDNIGNKDGNTGGKDQGYEFDEIII